MAESSSRVDPTVRQLLSAFDPPAAARRMDVTGCAAKWLVMQAGKPIALLYPAEVGADGRAAIRQEALSALRRLAKRVKLPCYILAKWPDGPLVADVDTVENKLLETVELGVEAFKPMPVPKKLAVK